MSPRLPGVTRWVGQPREAARHGRGIFFGSANSNASLWGANAVNGIINIVTKSSKDTQGGYVTAGGGNVLQSLGEIRLGGRLNDQTTFRIYGKASNSDKQFSPEGDSHDRWMRVSGGMRLDWQPDKSNLVTLDGGFTRSETGADDRFALWFGPPFGRNIPETEQRDSEHILARWTHELNSGSNMTLQAYWDRYQLIGDSNYRNARWNTFDVDFQTARNLLSRPPHRKGSERGSVPGSEGV